MQIWSPLRTLYILNSTPPVDLSSFSTIFPKSTLAAALTGDPPEAPDLALPNLPDLDLLLPECDLPKSKERLPAFSSEPSVDAAVSIIATRGADDLPEVFLPCKKIMQHFKSALAYHFPCAR